MSAIASATAIFSSASFNTTYAVLPVVDTDPAEPEDIEVDQEPAAATPSHVDLTDSFDITCRDIEDPT